MRQNNPGNITIEALYPAYGGLSVGRLEGRVVLIRGAIPGETVEARIDVRKKDYLEATAVRVVFPSPDRFAPESPYFGRCGGCQLQHISYAGQVRLKEEVLRSTLQRIAGIEVVPSPSLTGVPWGYRRRGQFKVSVGKLGFYRERSREVVDVEQGFLGQELEAAHALFLLGVEGELAQRGIGFQRQDIDTRDHNLTRQGIAKMEDRIDHLAFIRLKRALGLILLSPGFQFILGDRAEAVLQHGRGT